MGDITIQMRADEAALRSGVSTLHVIVNGQSYTGRCLFPRSYADAGSEHRKRAEVNRMAILCNAEVQLA